MAKWFSYIFSYIYVYISEKSMAPHSSTLVLQYSCLENPMDRGAWWAVVHGVAKSRTRLSDFTFTFHFPALEKEMATHSSVLAWRIPGTGEPGGLPSMGSHRVGHDWSDLAACIYILLFFMFHCGLSEDTEYSSLCYTVEPCCLSILYVKAYIC